MSRGLLLRVVVIVISGCSGSERPGCTLECNAETGCPSGYLCLEDGYCHESDREILCGDESPGPGEPDPEGNGGGADASSGAGGADATGVSEATCGDGLRNGGEADVDCGGPCQGCGGYRACALDADCRSGTCLGVPGEEARCEPTVVRFDFATAATAWLVPDGVTRLAFVTVIGGGGGGSSGLVCGTSCAEGWGGGSGGSLLLRDQVVTPGQPMRVEVGAGGRGGVGQGCAQEIEGLTGGDSWFGDYSASGGQRALSIYLAPGLLNGAPGGGGVPDGRDGTERLGGRFDVELRGAGGDGMSCAPVLAGNPYDPNGLTGSPGLVVIEY
jgi:hypothetical protein